MKKYVLSAIILSFAFLISIERANAQNNRQIKAEIPFEFSVGGKTFEAGKYIFAINNLNGTKAFQLIDENNNSRIIIYTMSVGYDSTSKNNKVLLYFRRYGNQYFLSRISDPGNFLNVEISKSKEEVFVAKNFNKNKSEVVSISKKE